MPSGPGTRKNREIWMTATSVAIGVMGTALMAWGLSRPELPGRRIIFLMVLVTIVFEPGIIPDYFLMKRLGLLNTPWAVILYKAISAWYLIILVRFFEEIPKELLEAAELDGAVQRVESMASELDANDAPATPEQPTDPEHPQEPTDPEPGTGEPVEPANPDQPIDPQPEPVDPNAPVQ